MHIKNIIPVFLICCFSLFTVACSKVEVPCGARDCFAKNVKIISKWIGQFADFMHGGQFIAGSGSLPDTITFPPQDSILGDAIGTVADLTDFTGVGTRLAEALAQDGITCTTDDLCEHCPPTPKIWFSCGEDCELSSQSAEAQLACQDAADLCFQSLLTAAVASHHQGVYTRDRVRIAMNVELARNDSCQKVKGLHVQCEEAQAREEAKECAFDQAPGGTTTAAQGQDLTLEAFAQIVEELNK